jgi:hypothetical protein
MSDTAKAPIYKCLDEYQEEFLKRKEITMRPGNESDKKRES